jgi:hypothetical protein
MYGLDLEERKTDKICMKLIAVYPYPTTITAVSFISLFVQWYDNRLLFIISMAKSRRKRLAIPVTIMGR